MGTDDRTWGLAPAVRAVATKQNIPPTLVNDRRRQIATPWLEQGVESPDTSIEITEKRR